MKPDDEAKTVEVRVYRDGRLVHQELCESEDEAALVVEQWNERPGFAFEVDDLSSPGSAGQILDLEVPEPLNDEAYPTDWILRPDRERSS